MSKRKHRKRKSRLKKLSILSGKVVLACSIVYGIYAISLSVYNYQKEKTVPATTESIEIPPVKPLTVEDWLSAVNTERAKVGAKPLQLHAGLNRSAQLKADELKIEKHFEHENLAGVKTGLNSAQKEAYRCVYVSENLVQTSDIEIGIRSWLGSSAHRQAMLDPKYEYTGFGLVDGYTVEHFADCN